ncbi:MAG: hypothetical protein V3U54_09265 [Thermodesulfobacteriota bacterium]|jgi:hypothetical protein
MSRKQKKISEAAYCYNKMLTVRNNAEYFHYELSAFLSAVRSPLQYAYEEVKGTTKQKWYDNKISNSPILKFFKDKRDINIHERPIQANQHLDLRAFEPICISDAVDVAIRRPDGSVVKRDVKPESTPVISKDPIPATLVIGYKFSDWQGPEDVFSLCKQYLNEVKEFIKEGIQKGFLSN